MSIYGDLMKLNDAQKANPPEHQQPDKDEALSPITKVARTSAQKPKGPKHTMTPRYHGTTIPRHHDTTVSRHHDTMISIIRGEVKVFGKEAATHRFTLEEKKAIADIVYAHKHLGIKTSENEIARIGVNFLINDYKENGENSVLSKVLKALNE